MLHFIAPNDVRSIRAKNRLDADFRRRKVDAIDSPPPMRASLPMWDVRPEVVDNVLQRMEFIRLLTPAQFQSRGRELAAMATAAVLVLTRNQK